MSAVAPSQPAAPPSCKVWWGQLQRHDKLFFLLSSKRSARKASGPHVHSALWRPARVKIDTDTMETMRKRRQEGRSCSVRKGTKASMHGQKCFDHAQCNSYEARISTCHVNKTFFEGHEFFRREATLRGHTVATRQAQRCDIIWRRSIHGGRRA